METKHLVYRDPLKGDVHVSFCWCKGTDHGDYVWKDVVSTIPERRKKSAPEKPPKHGPERSAPYYYAGAIAGHERMY